MALVRADLAYVAYLGAGLGAGAVCGHERGCAVPLLGPLVIRGVEGRWAPGRLVSPLGGPESSMGCGALSPSSSVEASSPEMSTRTLVAVSVPAPGVSQAPLAATVGMLPAV